MATKAQIDANRANALRSTGPKTADGKSRSAQNANKFGLFSTANCVLSHERDEYETFIDRLWEQLNPADPIEEIMAGEFIRNAWRLRRCAHTESEMAGRTQAGHEAAVQFQKENAIPSSRGPNPSDPVMAGFGQLQKAVDRARVSAHAGLRRAHADIAKIQAARIDENAEPEPATATGQNEPNFIAAPAIAAEQNEPDSTTASTDNQYSNPNSAPVPDREGAHVSPGFISENPGVAPLSEEPLRKAA